MILRIYRRFKSWYNMIWKHKYKIEIGLAPKIPFFTRLKYGLKGFTEEDCYNFNLEENDYHDYICYKERFRLEFINGRFADIMGEKVLFETLFGRHINVPHIYAWVKNKKLIDPETGNEVDIIPVLQKQKKLVAKPSRSAGGGSGFHILTFENSVFTIDDKECPMDELNERVRKWNDAIFVEFIGQAEYSSTIFPDSANSIRVITARHKNGEFEMLLAFHRFGSSGSKHVDNISSGGLVSLVDMETGTLGIAKRKTEPQNTYTCHPDTGAAIAGTKVTNWEQIKNKLLEVHKQRQFFNFIAWDVVVGKDGKPYVLEINRGSDLGVQMLLPLRHEKLGQFMREYGMLQKW